MIDMFLLIKITPLNLWPLNTFSVSLIQAAPLHLLFLFFCAPHTLSSPPTVTVHVRNWNTKLSYKQSANKSFMVWGFFKHCQTVKPYLLSYVFTGSGEHSFTY